uniref:peptidyl-tRNA hydrolase n=1 Tax=Amorphochlora amoebiformis TaxID=1561963 RepID=A0A7S0D2N0_9EUKA|mmetsp:Transcript_18247/g.29078  ORF Transcript_18247/g.29078 Transcript_18247/m.29078 type:complete len:187 (+) Transcript_18247:20-580(+)
MAALALLPTLCTLPSAKPASELGRAIYRRSIPTHRLIDFRVRRGMSRRRFYPSGGHFSTPTQRNCATQASEINPIVQYIVVRRDLGWGTGPLMAQACHASTAAIWMSKDSESTLEYLEDLDNMHKVILSAKNEKALAKVARNLEQGGVGFKLWIEQPENIMTALATFPRHRDEIKPHTKGLQLFRD